MSEPIDELAARRFEMSDDPAKTRPLDAIEAARKFIMEKAPGEEIEHVIILTGRTMPENGSGTRYFQAGTYAHHAMMGLCWEGMQMIREGDE